MSLTLCCISSNGAHKNRIKISGEEKQFSCKTMITIAAVLWKRNAVLFGFNMLDILLYALKFHFHGKNTISSLIVFTGLFWKNKREHPSNGTNKQFKIIILTWKRQITKSKQGEKVKTTRKLCNYLSHSFSSILLLNNSLFVTQSI